MTKGLSASPFSAGTKIAQKYRLVRPLGEGAMDTVWLAVNEGTGGEVALKLILGPEPQLRRRLLREARAAGAIAHFNVIKIHDVGQTEAGDPFLVMELLHGETLAQRLSRKRRVDQVEAAAIGRDIAKALGAAHDKGIVHRDLKPSNIFLHSEPGVEGPVVKVLDFGLSKSERNAEGLRTALGGAVGSPMYMSPEQAKADPTADARSDIWSLGVVLFEMLSGERPFQGSALEILQKLASGDIPALGRRVRKIDPALDRLVSACLKRAPEERPWPASELARELAALAVPGRAPLPSVTSERASMPPERASLPPERASLPSLPPERASLPSATSERAPLPSATSERAPLPSATSERASAPLSSPAPSVKPPISTRTEPLVQASPGHGSSALGPSLEEGSSTLRDLEGLEGKATIPLTLAPLATDPTLRGGVSSEVSGPTAPLATGFTSSGAAPVSLQEAASLPVADGAVSLLASDVATTQPSARDAEPPLAAESFDVRALPDRFAAPLAVAPATVDEPPSSWAPRPARQTNRSLLIAALIGGLAALGMVAILLVSGGDRPPPPAAATTASMGAAASAAAVSAAPSMTASMAASAPSAAAGGEAASSAAVAPSGGDGAASAEAAAGSSAAAPGAQAMAAQSAQAADASPAASAANGAAESRPRPSLINTAVPPELGGPAARPAPASGKASSGKQGGGAKPAATAAPIKTPYDPAMP